MTKLGPALDYDPFQATATTLGPALDYDPFATPPANENIPLPPERPEEFKAAAEPAAVEKPTVEAETVPGSLEAKRQLLSTQAAAAAKSVANIEDIQARMAKGERFDPMTELEASPENLERLKKTQSEYLAAVEQTKQQIEAQPETEFSKSVQKARETNNLPDLAKTLWEGVKNDPVGARRALTETIVGGAPIAAATVAGGGVGGGIYGGAIGYSDALIEETLKRSPDPEKLRADIARGDTKEFDKIYGKYRNDIDAAATRKGVVGGTFGTVFGMIPGANTFLGGVKNLMVKYAPLGTIQAVAENEITKVPVIDTDTGKPKLDASGNVILQDAERLSPSEIAIAYGVGIASGVPFEAMHLVKKGAAKVAPSKGAREEPPPPPPPGAGPEAPAGGPEAPAGGPEVGPENIDISQTRGYQEATRDDAILRNAFEEDIQAGRMTREEALDRIAGMSREEAAARARLFRQVGGEALEAKPLDLADFEYIQSKRQPSAPGAEAPPPGAEEAAAPQPKVPTEEAEILKGAGYTVDDVLTMGARERAAAIKEAQDAQVKPAKLTDEEAALLYPEKVPKAEVPPEDRPTRLGEPIELPPPRAEEAPAAPPSPVPAVEARGPEAVIPSPSAPPAAPSVAQEMVRQGADPLIAMRRAAEQRQAAQEGVIPMPPPAAEAAPISMPPPAEATVPTTAPTVAMQAPTVATPAPKVAKPKAPRAFWRVANLDTLIRKAGGIKDIGGDLKASNVPRNLINNKNGRPLENVLMDAIERGYYPQFQAQMIAEPDGNYPTKEMVETFKADVGKKKLHPEYQEDVEAAKREGEEQFIFGPFMEQAEARARELSIAKDDPVVRAAAVLAANGQAKDINDAFDKILFADAAEIADDWSADRADIANAIGDDAINEIDEFLAGEGFTARGKPLEADYEPQPLPIQEAGAAIREEGEPAREPIEEGRVEEPRKEVAKPVSGKAEGKPEIEKMKTEPGAEGKPQGVIPGAEKASQADILKKKAAAPLKAKKPQKEPGGLFSDEANQKDLFDLIKKQDEEVKAAPKPPEWLQDRANYFSGVIVHSGKDAGLVLGYNALNGEPVYIAVKRLEDGLVINTRVDISEFNNKTSMFTAEEMKELKDARREFKARDLALWELNPDGPFEKGDFVGSPNMPDSLVQLTKDWAKMLGLNVRIYLTTPQDARLGTFHGPYKRIGASGMSLKDGLKIPLGGSDYAIALPLKSKMSFNLEALAHEMGHILQAEEWEYASKEIKEAVIDDYKRWLLKTNKMNAEELVKSLRAHVIGKLTTGLKGKKASDLPPYWRSFNEYFADNVARYMMSEEKPQSVVGKYFKRIADALKRLYNSLAGMSSKASKSMKEYLDGLINKRDNIMDGKGPKADDQGLEMMKSSFDKETVDDINAMNEKYGMKAPPKRQKDFPVETTNSIIARNFQDEFAFLKKIQNYIVSKRGAPLPESADAYARANLMPGRTSERIADFEQNTVIPIFNKMKEYDVSGEDLGLYMYAEHALERNPKMAERDPKRFGADGGSGMANGTAKEILKRYDNRKAQMDELAAMVRKMIDEDLDRRVEAGLMSEEQAADLRKNYKKYVPLRGFAELSANEEVKMQYNFGRGIGVSKTEMEQAMGRMSVADNPFLNAILQSEEGIYRAEKNRAARALLTLAQSNPNPDLWTVNKMKLHKEIGIDGLAKWVTDGMVGPNTVIAKIGGVPYYIDLKHPGLAEAYKKIGVTDMWPILRGMGKLTRIFSQLQTSKNPAFLFKNILMDYQTSKTAAKLEDPAIAKNMNSSLGEAFTIAMQAARGKLSPDNKAIYDEWRLTGGKISYNAFKDMEGWAKELESIVGDMDPATWKNLPKKTLNAAMGVVKKMWMGLDKIGQPFEEIMRLNVYIAARKIKLPNGDHKYTPQQAARFSQDFTVNFFRKGKYTPQLNAAYAFFNAAVQGDAYLLPKLFGTKAGRRLVFLKLMPLFFMLQTWNLLISDDDKMDKDRNNYLNIPESERAKSFIIKTGSGPKDYIRIPSIPVFSSLWDFSGNVMFMVMGQKKPKDAIVDWFANTISSHNPLSETSPIGALMPTILQPFYDVSENKNYFGSPIHPKEEPWNIGIPRYQQTFPSTSETATKFAEFVNTITFGGIDIYPSDAEHIAKSIIGAVGVNAGNIVAAMNDLASGKELSPQNVPVVKYFVPSKWDESGRYYAVKEKFDGFVNRQRKDTGAGPPMASIVNKFDDMIKVQRDLIRSLKQDDKLSPRQKQIREEKARKDIADLMNASGKIMVEFLRKNDAY